MTTARPAAQAATSSSRVQKHEPVVGWGPSHSSCSSLKVRPQLSISLALVVTRGTGILPYQALEQEMTRLSLTGAHPNQIWTAYPTKLDGDAMAGDFAAFNGISQEG
jgi:hypothetical protein